MTAGQSTPELAPLMTRGELIELLNDDLAHEHQAVISYMVCSQMLKEVQSLNIAAEHERHAAEELAHAITIAAQIDYLGGVPLAVARPVQPSTRPQDMLRFDLESVTDTIARYRERIPQCEALGEYAVAQHLRKILVQEQDHQIALASALGVELPSAQRPQTRLDKTSSELAGALRTRKHNGQEIHNAN